ncbi:hypothetical protein J4G33_04100 [Actinotalea sp. BY-33]|uniref:Uncharacterized protein n=1 Tax=Actinotalea soli TaxID=2819234 RepID=A0A939LRU3_9CELL|nr:hypothetical protein [Actinotalea soli]MBO1750979.1 hypothetical protein [Actinotalea soli]
MSAAPRRPVAPVVLRVALVLVLLEAAVLTALSLWWLVVLVGEGSRVLAVALFLLLFGLGVAAVLVAAARALLAGSRRARGPVITWQLLQGATAVTLLQGGIAWGWPLLALAAAILVLLMTRPVVAHTTHEVVADPEPV